MAFNPTTFKPLTVSKASAGSGKTFTLSAYYIAMLLSGEDFRSILAVTFTNKATEEMRKRILTYLYAIAQGTVESGFTDKIRDIMTHIGYCQYPVDAQERAGNLYREILAEYDQMRIVTIDSFLQTLYNGMTQALGMPTGTDVELDVKHAITTSVDKLLSDDIDAIEYPGLHKLISDFIQARLNDDKKGDIRAKLISIAEELYKENVQAQDYRRVNSSATINAFRKNFDWKTKTAYLSIEDDFKHLKAIPGLETVEGFIKLFAKPQVFKWFYTNIEGSLSGTVKEPLENSFKSYDFKDFLNSVTDMQFDTSVPMHVCNEVYVRICRINSNIPACRQAYIYGKFTFEFLHEVQALNFIRNHIDRSLEEQNVQLLANASNKLSQVLKGGDGAFILEKAGLRYHHIMLDEFQDTSILGWKNFLSLILEVLALQPDGGVPHTCLIVGDVKQSLYRFRNASWQIMDSIGPTMTSLSTVLDPVMPDHAKLANYFDTTTKPLSKSFRSRYEVVKFNVSLFEQIAKMEKARISADPVYASSSGISADVQFDRIFSEKWNEAKKGDFYVEGKHEGGFVRGRFYPYSPNKIKTPGEELIASAVVKERILTDMFVQINDLLTKNPDYARHILILISNKTESALVVKHFRKMQSQYNALAATGIASENSYLLGTSRSVQTVIAALRYLIKKDEVGKKFILSACKDAAKVLDCLNGFNPKMPLIDLVEEITTLCLCDADGRFVSEDEAFVNCFADRVRDYVARYGSNTADFLQYWDDQLAVTSVEKADTGIIRIMTLHKSKGLEAKTVFIPFCDWSMEKNSNPLIIKKIWCPVPAMDPSSPIAPILPIRDNELMQEAGFAQEYKDEHENTRLDHLNLLYVGLTRAADNLYIYGTVKPTAEWDSKNGKLKTKPADPALYSLPIDNVGSIIIDALGRAYDFNKAYIDYCSICNTPSADPSTCCLTFTFPVDSTAEPFVESIKRGQTGSDASKNPAESAEGTSVVITDPFSFKKSDYVTVIPVRICRNNKSISFRQSQKSELYATHSEDAGRAIEDSIRFGNILHDIMSKIEHIGDEECAIEDFRTAGIIDSDAMLDKIRDRINQMWKCDEMHEWFSGRYRLLLEAPLMAIDSMGVVHENRMDRVMIDEAKSEAIVLDYKFGADLRGKAMQHYEDQVRGYMNLLTRMGYQNVSGYLWLAEEKEKKHLYQVY